MAELRRGCVIALALGATVFSASALADPAGRLLSSLPTEATAGLAPLFTANALGQAGLNGQIQGTPMSVFGALKQSLTKAGYQEQPIRTTQGSWGFSATWALPDGVQVDGAAPGKTAVLVTQATALGPDRVNLNIRFEGI